MPLNRFGTCAGWSLSGHFCAPVILALSLASPAAFARKCTFGKIVEFPVTVTNSRPYTTARINDTDVQFLIDSGSFYGILSRASAAELKLATYPTPAVDFGLRGVGGTAQASMTKVKAFSLAGVNLHGIEFLVTQNLGGDVGILGQNILHYADVEYDLNQGAVRLMEADGCGDVLMAYWAGASTPYSVIEISSEAPRQSPIGTHIAAKPLNLLQTIGYAHVNDAEVRVMFDTGAPYSILSLQAAERAGIKPDSPGVVAAGIASGIGKGTIQTYIAPVLSFKIGVEVIRNTRLRIGDIDLPHVDMLLGVDFFLSHRIYVANSQHRVWFTYNGGPVFNLEAAKYHPAAAQPPSNPSPAGSAAPGTSVADATAAGDSHAQPAESARGDAAAEYSRRGAAAASRRDFDQALAAFTRACELAPDDPEYFHQRGMLYMQLKQTDRALADWDRVLELKPDDVRILVARARARLQGGDKPRAVQDLDAAASVAPKEDDVRLSLGSAYEQADLSAPAIAQYDLWIASHPDDARLPNALNGRCWARALEGVDLALARGDCDAAFKRVDKSSPLYAKVADSRGFVLLRLGEYEKSIADYDVSLGIAPRNAWSLYGRGIDELRQKKVKEGQRDIAQAMEAAPDIAEEFKRRGIVP